MGSVLLAGRFFVIMPVKMSLKATSLARVQLAAVWAWIMPADRAGVILVVAMTEWLPKATSVPVAGVVLRVPVAATGRAPRRCGPKPEGGRRRG